MRMESVDYHHHSNEGGESVGVQAQSVPSQSSGSGKVSRIRLNDAIEGPWTLEKVLDLWEEQDKYVDALEARVRHMGHRRENYLVMRLSSKEQELTDLTVQIRELKRLAGNSKASTRSLLDPALNLVLSRLKKELDQAKTKMSETQEELSAWKFTPDSVTGKRLMSKCRQLLQENEDIGKMIASGRLSKLEAELAMQKTLAAKMKKNQLEMDEFVQELDEDVEGMQSTIYYLQQQLREAKEKLSSYEKKEDNFKDTPSAKTKEDVNESEESPTDDKRVHPNSASRGRGRKNNTISKIDSPRRPSRGAKREVDDEDEEQPPQGKGRPKRRRNASSFPKNDQDISVQGGEMKEEEEAEEASNTDSSGKQNVEGDS
uniref:Pre-mRNA-splicing regulator female-lethal(2)D n=1 Tax=Lepeophtheirus salmonis TaxID=72036 RepID=A0A0K2UD83_LEPSM